MVAGWLIALVAAFGLASAAGGGQVIESAQEGALSSEAVGLAGAALVLLLTFGTTVVISMMGLFLMGLTYLQGVAVSAIVAVLLVMAATMTLLPALLGFAGHGINRLRLPGTARSRQADPQRAPAARWARQVQKAAVECGAGRRLVLLVMAVPVTGLRLGFPDAGNDRSETTTRQAYDLVSKGFGAGANGPLLLVPGAGDRAVLDRISAAAKAHDGVAAVTPPVLNRQGDTAVLTVNPTSSPQSERTEDLISRLREDVLPRAARGSGVHVDVGGTTAARSTRARRPLNGCCASSAASWACRSCSC